MGPLEMLNALLTTKKLTPVFMIKATDIKVKEDEPTFYQINVDIGLKISDAQVLYVGAQPFSVDREMLDHMTAEGLQTVAEMMSQAIGEIISEEILESMLHRSMDEIVSDLAEEAAEGSVDPGLEAHPEAPSPSPRPTPPPTPAPPPDIPFEDPTKSPLPPPMSLNKPGEGPRINPENINPPAHPKE